MKLWFKKKKKLDKDETNFIPLYPNDRNTSSVYVERLQEAFKDSKIHNIGITGPYGSGKSSVIESFLKTIKNQNSVFTISLATFNKEGIPVSDNNGDGKKENNDLEVGILQQIIYRINPKKIPLSKIVRIKEEREWLFRIVVSLLIYIINYSSINSFLVENLKINITNWFAIFLVHMFILFVIFISLGIILRKFNITSISFNGVDFIKESQNESILNKYIDEIIYVLKKSKCKVIVFEDIDRFDSQEIFFKLRELNKILNDNNIIKARGGIKFIYAIRDDIFNEEEERTKFFDYILPIIPIISNNNSQFKFIDIMKKIGLENIVDKKTLQDVSYFVNDMRIAINICNEFKVYYEKIYKELKKDKHYDYSANKLFVIIAYKNLEMEDFKSMQCDEGLINNFIDLKNDFKLYYDNEIKKIEDKLNEIEKEEIEKLNNLSKEIKLEIKNKYHKLEKKESEFYEIGEKQYSSLDEICDTASIEDIFKYGIYGSELDKTVNIDEIDNKNNWEKDYNNLIDNYNDYKESHYIELSELKKIKPLEESLYTLLSRDNDIINKIKNVNNLATISRIKQNKTFFAFVLKGYIEEDYRYYINNVYLNDLTIEEYNFIANIKTLKPISNVRTLIINPNNVLIRLDLNDFDNKYILNLNLIDFLLDNINFEDNCIKLEKIYSHIFKNNDNGKFFIECINSLKNIKLFLQKLITYMRFNLWNELKINITDEVELSKTLIAMIRNLDVLDFFRIRQWEEIRDFLQNNCEINNVEDIIEINRVFDNKEFKLKNISNNKKEIIEFIFKKRLYELNINNIKNILLYLEPNKEHFINENLFLQILATKNKVFIDYIKEEINSFIKNIILNADYKMSYEEFLEICKCEINEDLFIDIIKKFKIVIKDFSDVNSNYWKNIVILNCFNVTIANILKYFNKYKFNHYLIKTIHNNIKTIEMDCYNNINILKKNNFKDFIEKLVTDERIVDNDVFKLLEVYKKLNYKILSIPKENINSNRIEFLISKNLIKFNKNNYFKINKYYKNELIQFCVNNIECFIDNYEIIKNKVDDNLKCSIIKSKISESIKIQLLKKIKFYIVEIDKETAEKILSIINRKYNEYIEFFNYGFIIKLFTIIGKVDTKDKLKVRIINRYFDKLENDQIIKMCSLLSDKRNIILRKDVEVRIETEFLKGLLKKMNKRKIVEIRFVNDKMYSKMKLD